MNSIKLLRAIILYGNPKPIITYFKTILKIKSVYFSELNPFQGKKLKDDLQIAEEQIIYGTNLSQAQKTKINLLKLITTNKIIEGLFLGGYMNKHGEITFKPFQEISVSILVMTSLMLNIFWLSGLITIVTLSYIPALNKLQIIIIYLIPFGVYSYFFTSYCISPIISYFKLIHPTKYFY